MVGHLYMHLMQSFHERARIKRAEHVDGYLCLPEPVGSLPGIDALR